MKTLITVLALSTGLALSAVSLAKPERAQAWGEERQAKVAAMQETAVDQLDLLPAQAEQVKALMAEHAAKRAALRSEFAAAQDALLEEHKTAMGDLLSEEEMTELKKTMRKQLRNNFKEGRKKQRCDKAD